MNRIVKNYYWQDIIRLSIEKNISIERMLGKIIENKGDRKKILSLIDQKLNLSIKKEILIAEQKELDSKIISSDF